MIKLIHTADWHLGQVFFGNDRGLEHEHFLDWLASLLYDRQVNVLLISGDVFDVANPSAASQRMFYRFLRRITAENTGLQVVIIAGNHDSPARLEAPLPLLEEMNITIKGILKRTYEGQIDFDDLIVRLNSCEGKTEAFCMAVPFLRQGDYPVVETEGNPYAEGVKMLYSALYDRVKVMRTSSEAIIAMGHLQATGSEIAETDHSERTVIGGLECVSPSAFDEAITYTALGHIHKSQRVSRRENVRYAGSPLPMSFAERNYHHGVVEVILEHGALVSVERLEYKPLVSLLSIPAEAQSPDKVLEELAALPDMDDQNAPAPYLEVKVLLEEPEPVLRHRIEEVLEGKHVRLSRIISRYREKSEGSDEDEGSMILLEDMNPLQIAETVYRNKYASEMPDELKHLFLEVCLEINQSGEGGI